MKNLVAPVPFQPTKSEAEAVLQVSGLSIELRPRRALPRALLSEVDLSIGAGSIHAIVGESGSGKTLLGRAVLGLLPAGVHVSAGSILFQGADLTHCSGRQLRAIRGAGIGMVFQEPMVSLNPATRIGEQMAEALRIHTEMSETQIRDRCIEMLTRIRLTRPAEALKAYPHEFSGGMRQRIMLASVLMMRPRLLIADEPTTALDALIQKEVLDIMVEIARDQGTAVALITHDLALVSQYADTITVMERGRVIERGAAATLFERPGHPYTRALLAAVPNTARASRPASRTTVLSVRDVHVSYPAARDWPWSPRRHVDAVKGISFDIGPGETVAIVGESGSGKTTIGRAVLRLKEPRLGQVKFLGENVLAASPRRLQALRRSMQIVFQDPASSLDPRMRIREVIGEGLLLDPQIGPSERAARVAAALQEVGLTPEQGERFPHELSGGQRQRVAIARAVVMRPALIVADEPVSALDVTIQMQILQLLKSLQATHGFACLFISHDLGVVEEVADRVIVMYRGHVLEVAPGAEFFSAARHPYARRLLTASPRLERDDAGAYRSCPRAVGPNAAPAGRDFFEDVDATPSMVEVGPEHTVACMPLVSVGATH